MPDRILIVARLAPGSSGEVARLFADSDSGELPHALGVTRRDLFTYRDLYFHHVEFAGDADKALSAARERDDFRRLSEQLSAYVTPYDPATWRSPADAVAQRFYHWTPAGGAL
ncbi:TcmI family type II polyketide cyclase [Thermostaphylospora chromogena]|uniref:Cyclase n=1 Tax=Thermostaphylospora chromogena TaxID=35622 RepID=A0A1H1I1Y4_9ACTN|nr:TcmI family type II polyketide cyclase [Thermostaphylospora chromogena]SDR31346.1 cyclase [Thermostaphylospora chromogena]